MKILVFGASYRKDSYNQVLAKLAGEKLKATGMEVDFVPFQEFSMPVYDGDLESEKGLPMGAQKLLQKIQWADALVISTPEYNGSISGAFKNAVDWVSRARPIPFPGKHVLLFAASQGRYSGMRGLMASRYPLEVLGCYVFPDMIGYGDATKLFNDKGAFNDSKNNDLMEKILAKFVAFIQRK
jgi:chromate reductase